MVETRVVSDQPHPERTGALRDQGSDPAKPNDPECLAMKLDALPLLAFPPARDEGGVSLGDVPSLGQQQRDRVLRGRQDVRLGGVHNQDAEPGRGIHVHVVEPDAGPSDHLQILGSPQQGRVHLSGGADDQCVVIADDLLKLLGRQTRLHIDIEVLAQALQTGRCELLGS
jgi:hypothetical protein